MRRGFGGAVTLLFAAVATRAALAGDAADAGTVAFAGGRAVVGAAALPGPAAERPSREVDVAPFAIDRTEVTVDAYRACVARRACARPRRTSASCTYDRGEPTRAVNCVTWEMATRFCAARGMRLPTEIEWEVAARSAARGSTVSAPQYPWGGGVTTCEHAVTLRRAGAQESCSSDGPMAVGSRPLGRTAEGLVDMSGNVEEWVADFWSESTLARPPIAGASHVLRGGGWLSSPSRATVTSRSWGSEREAGPNVGFRCAVSLPPDPSATPPAR